MASHEAKGLGSMYSNTSTVPSYAELQPYLADLSTLPPLSEQEEADLLLAQQGHLSPEQAHAAKQRLVEGCLRRVIRIAREQEPFFHRHSLSDLIQEGNLGVMQAVKDTTLAIRRATSLRMSRPAFAMPSPGCCRATACSPSTA